MPDESWQEEGATSLHNEPAARKHKADLRVTVAESYVHGQRHCDADTNGGALQGADCGLPAVEDGEGNPAASVQVDVSFWTVGSSLPAATRRFSSLVLHCKSLVFWSEAVDIPVPMILHPLCTLSGRPLPKFNTQICAGAEHRSISC